MASNKQMESAVSGSKKMELIQKAIQQFNESKHNLGAVTDDHGDDDDGHHLAKLLSQLESSKVDGSIKPCELSAEPNDLPLSPDAEMEVKDKEATDTAASNTGSVRAEDVVKELKKLERQNKITHVLLSGLIVLTAVWQLSEFSILLKLKHGVTHPFKSLGSMVTKIFRRPVQMLETEPQPSKKQDETDNPLMDFSGLIINSNGKQL